MDLSIPGITNIRAGNLTFMTADYTEDDFDPGERLNRETDLQPLNDYEKLDVDGSGAFGAADMSVIRRAIDGTQK